MKRVIKANSNLNDVSILGYKLQLAYVEGCRDGGWTEDDMVECSDPFYTNDDNYRLECAKFMIENFDMSKIDDIKFHLGEDDYGFFELYTGGRKVGVVSEWYSTGRYDFSVEESNQDISASHMITNNSKQNIEKAICLLRKAKDTNDADFAWDLVDFLYDTMILENALKCIS